MQNQNSQNKKELYDVNNYMENNGFINENNLYRNCPFEFCKDN